MLDMFRRYIGHDVYINAPVFMSERASFSRYFQRSRQLGQLVTPFTDQTGTASGANSVEVQEIFYDFPIGEKLRVVVDPRINWYRYFDNNAYTFFLTGARSFNSSGGTLVNPIDRGSGAVITYDFNDSLTFKVGYLGENTEFLPSEFFNTSSDPNNGLFSATQTLTAEINMAIAERANIRLLYTRATVDNNQLLFDADGNLTGFGVRL